jgi:hypothetical protein
MVAPMSSPAGLGQRITSAATGAAVAAATLLEVDMYLKVHWARTSGGGIATAKA